MIQQGLMSHRSSVDGLRQTLRVYGTALRTAYQPKQYYRGPVSLILADDLKLDALANWRVQEEMLQGWRQWAPEVVGLKSDGHHFSMLRSPYVHGWLEKCGWKVKSTVAVKAL